MEKEDYEKIVELDPAWDRRDPNPSQKFGIGAVKVRMVLKGKLGAVHFVFSTGMYPKHIYEEWAKTGDRVRKFDYMGYDVGYHSKKKQWKDQKARPNCPYLNGKKCYMDGSALLAEEYEDILLKGGSKAVWKELTKYYKQHFN